MVLQNTIPAGVWRLMRRNKEILRYNGKWGKHWDSQRQPGTTGLHPTDLSRDEEKLYNLIVKRVIEAFTPDENDFQKKARKKRKSHKKAG